jgi:hypothetical protein
VGRRLPNPRLVKVHRNYSVEEIAHLFGLHKNTVRHWLKQGLATIDDRRPTLVLGNNLSRFLHERRQKGKQSCGPGRIFCIACRAPKVPAGQMAECIPTGPRAGNLRGICPDCDRLIYRRVNPAKIDAVRGELEITFTRPPSRIGESAGPSVNCDSGEKLLVAMLRQQAAVMSRKGIPLDVVQRECRKLESAIRAEMWRHLLLPDDVA